MVENSEGQVHFLHTIGAQLPANISLVNELSDLLEISTDSAYRRLRGETMLTYPEIVILCQHYKISFDSINNTQANVVSFGYRSFEETKDSFYQYLSGLSSDLERLVKAEGENKQIIYAGQGIPILHYFQFPILSAFKMFYWMKSIMNVSDFHNQGFNAELINSELKEVGSRLYDHYLEVDSSEIWSDTTIMGTLRQIQFYWDTGVFKNEKEAHLVLDEFDALLEKIQAYAESGSKQDSQGKSRSDFHLYHSEVEFENNCIFLEINDLKSVYLSHLSFGAIKTIDQRYCEETKKWLMDFTKKANLISEVSETMRYQFFRRCHKQVEIIRNKILND